MGFRDFLLGAQQFAEGTKGVREVAELERRRAAQNKLRDMYPEIIAGLQSGDPELQAQVGGQYLAESQEAGGNAVMDTGVRDVLFSNLTGKKKALLDPTGIRAVNKNIPDEDVLSISGLTDRDAQNTAIKNYMSQKDLTLEGGRQVRHVENFGLRTEESTQKQAEKTFTVLDKTKNAFREEGFKVSEMQDIAKRKGQLADNIVANFVIRNVGNEKGPLSNDDRGQILGAAQYQGTWDEFISKFTGESYSKMNPSARAEIDKIIKNAAANFESRKQEALFQDVKDLYLTNPKLRDKKTGQPKGLLLDASNDLKKLGVDITFSPDGQVSRGKKFSMNVNDAAKGLLEKAKNIPDQKAKKQIGLAIQALGGNITEEQLKILEEKFKNELGAK